MPSLWCVNICLGLVDKWLQWDCIFLCCDPVVDLASMCCKVLHMLRVGLDCTGGEAGSLLNGLATFLVIRSKESGSISTSEISWL